MSEITKYEAYKKKLQGVCDENDLVFRFRAYEYPITLTISPVQGAYHQMSMLENVEEEGYTSPDAKIVFCIKDGVISYKTYERFTISDTLFTKIKNLFRNMHYLWLQYFFRDVVERELLTGKAMPAISEQEAQDYPEGAQPLEEFEDEDEPDLPEEDETHVSDEDISKAISIVRAENGASISLLQRRMKIGYSRASHIIDQHERIGVIGEYNGAKPREVLPFDVPDDEGGESNAEM